jgi:hypothetical protein
MNGVKNKTLRFCISYNGGKERLSGEVFSNKEYRKYP